MTEAYTTFASYLRFKEVLSDPLGHLDRAGEYDASGVRRAVWLRVFDRPQIAADDVVEAFDRVWHIAEEVQSTNLPTGVDCIADNGTPAMAIDYVASQPLSLVFSRVSSEQFPIAVDNALLIAEKIAIALCATLTTEIDGERVVHGFLHPGLIFVTNDGEGLVSGFGLGESLLGLIDDSASVESIHPYLAPEILHAKLTSRRGDVYSLGAILFHLLTGSALPAAPEQRSEAIATAKLAYDEEPLPTDITALLKRALAPHAEDRFSSASDFKKELDRLLYGGAYSPTTFNLALFMDRLFRAEIEAEEAALAREMAVDVSPYLQPVTEPEAVLETKPVDVVPRSITKPVWIAAGVAGVAAIAALLWFSFGRGLSTPPVPPTPTAEEIAAQRLEQEEKMRTLAEGLVAEMMAAKEDEIRQELLDRQQKIDELQRRLAESERRSQQGQLSTADVRRRQELQQQIAAEEEAQRRREAELEAERVEAEETARRQATIQQTATAAAATLAAVAPVATPTSPPRPATPVPTVVPTPPPTVTAAPTRAEVVENSFVDPTEVDSLPIVIKEAQVEWPRPALFSRRQGVVILQAMVNADGVVEDVKLLRADHEGFGIPQAVMDAVKQYRFKPATKDGVKVKTLVTVTKPYRFVTR